MIEYANESVIKLLKQYDMLSKSLKYITSHEERRDISYQMTRIIQDVIEITNSSYEIKYLKAEKKTAYLMDEEKSRLLELINLINERRTYVNNQIINNRELTGINLETEMLLGEDKLEEYKEQVKVIDRYKNNIKLEEELKNEIKTLDINIKRANDKLKNNDKINKQLEEKMIRLLEKTFEQLSLFELVERKKEIDLAYTELGYSLEKAKENAAVARRDCTEKIILECDNMLASITLEYERYKEKKLILKLIDIYKEEINTYEELLAKREEINNVLINIQNSELYSLVGYELNKQYATIKLEGQDIATLKSLVDEKNLKEQKLNEVIIDNNSEVVKNVLANLLENEKKYQAKLAMERKKKEEEQKELERIKAIKIKEEMAKRQKLLEEERKKEIERRTKQLLVEKKNPVLISQNDEKNNKKEIDTIKNKIDITSQPTRDGITGMVWKKELTKPTLPKKEERDIKVPPYNEEIIKNIPDDFFAKEHKTSKIVDKGIPVIKNDNLNNNVVSAKEEKFKDEKIFPDIPLNKEDKIFPDFPEIKNTTSFFDENEFDDLKDYLDDEKKGWF